MYFEQKTAIIIDNYKRKSIFKIFKFTPVETITKLEKIHVLSHMLQNNNIWLLVGSTFNAHIQTTDNQDDQSNQNYSQS
jgi:hypothetical protein